MAQESEDKSQKTEEPTSKRIEDAYKKGHAPISRELNNWFLIIALFISTFFFASSSFKSISHQLKPFFSNTHTFIISINSLKIIFLNVFLEISKSLFIPFLIIFLFTISTSLIQSYKAISLENLKPKLNRISISNGIKKIFSKQAFIELFKAFFKFIILSLVLFFVLKPNFQKIGVIVGGSLEDFFNFFSRIWSDLFIGLILAFGLLAGFDFWLQKRNFIENLKMTKQEIKEEFKDLEGDPKIKARIRQVRNELLKKSIKKIIPQATVVVTNPTHVSVAIKWDEKIMNAPQVIFKGQDYIALQIREIAKANKIPLIENVKLARSLYANVKVDQEIMPEHYEMVAEIIKKIEGMKRWL